MINRYARAPLALIASVLAACGGGGSSTAGIDGTGITGPTPTDTPAVAVGTVTGFGSIFVNGIRFDTSSAAFEIDDSPGGQDDLAAGDVVIVTGTVDESDATQGAATTVVFDDAVEGPVQSIDAVMDRVMVLGQTVLVSPGTSFDDSVQPASLEGLAVGQVVEVSGLVRSDGSIDATRIEPKPASAEWEITGRVAAHDAGSFSFAINALTVDYGSAMLQDFPGGRIADGDLVEVKGGTTLGAGGELVATRVELEGNGVAVTAGDRLEVEGFVTRFADASDFDVAGVRVATDGRTVFAGGAAADLGIDIKVEAEGRVDANGVLLALKVDIRRARAVRLYAAVDSTAPAASPPGTGSFVAFGITIDVDALTRREDKRDDVSSFGIDDLTAGDFVEVRGTEFPAGSGRILAGLVERDDADDSELQGFVTGVSGSEITILGVTILTDGAVFRDADDQPISSAQFFDELEVSSGGNGGSLVKATGVETGPQTIMATEVEFELEL